MTPKIRFIRHNENMTFQVTDGLTLESYVLRIHKPVEGFSLTTAQHSYEDLDFEMSLIDDIGMYADIEVQKPIRNRLGSFISTVEHHLTGEVMNVTLLSWINGIVLKKEDSNFLEEVFMTGVMTAKLHDFSKNWQYERIENRQRYDQEKVKSVISRIEEAVDLNLMTKEFYRIIQEGGEKICILMDELDKRSDSKGIIHADLQRTNLIAHDKEISPIDFGLCGFGYYYMDLGGLLADFGSLHIKTLLSGYSSVQDFHVEDIKYIEGFFVFSILLAMGTHLHNPQSKEWYL